MLDNSIVTEEKITLVSPKSPTSLPLTESQAPSAAAKLPRKRLLSEVELSLHTHTVRWLCLGYGDDSKIGLLRFAQLTQMLWSAVKQDDPYAEWHLIQLYDQMTALWDTIKQVENNCQQRLSQLRGLTVTLFTNPDPFKLQLRFASPFSFMAACLLTDLDYVERQFNTLKRLGLTVEGYPTITGFAPKVRAIFKKPLQWSNTGITRKDIQENNAKAQQVRATAGEVPPPILNKTVKFSFLQK